MKMNVPFYRQCWDLDAWEELGFKSREDAEYWQKSSCGILCVKMAMDGLRESPVQHSMKELIDIGVEQGAYTDVSGWSHDGLVGLLRSFSFEARRGDFSTKELRDALASGKLPIVSIKSSLKNTKSLKERIFFWKKRGGHLAVLIGYEEENGRLSGFYIHHTSNILEQNWEGRFVSLKKFLKGYSGRGILVG